MKNWCIATDGKLMKVYEINLKDGIIMEDVIKPFKDKKTPAVFIETPDNYTHKMVMDDLAKGMKFNYIKL